MSTKAKYGPLRWPEGRPRDERSRLLTGADLVVAAHERDSTGRHSKLGDCHWWAVEPWFLHHGISVEEGLEVISWLGYGYSIDTATVQHVVSGFNPAWWNLETYSCNLPKGPRLPSDYHDAADILIAAITEAQSGMPPGLNIYRDDVWKWAPAGVAECAKWWSGGSRYYEGRAPLARMVDLPGDALRCICELLAPTFPPKEARRANGTLRYGTLLSNEEFMAEARTFCDEEATDAALARVNEEELEDVFGDCEHYKITMRERIRDWHRERGNVAKRLPMVSRYWLRELKGPMNRIVAEAGPMNLHQAMLEDAYNKVWTLRHDNGAPYR